MRSDWHRYNLKRRVASLPPISSEVFTEKVLQARAATTAQADKAGFEKTCEVCQKTYYSENSFRNHLSSTKHKSKAAAAARRPANNKVDDDVSSMSFSLGEPARADSVVDSEAEEEFSEVVEGIKNASIHDTASPIKRPSAPQPAVEEQSKTDAQMEETPTTTPKPEALTPSATTCVFCNYESPTPQLNASHMERIHGMFIPEKQYLVDLEGLLKHLWEKVFRYNECLTCGKMKVNVFAIQTHMRDKSHYHIPYTTEEEQLEIGEFYDFRSTYSDGDWETEEEDKGEEDGGVRLGAKRESKVVDENGDEVMEDEEGWETDSDASSLDTDDLHAVPAEGHYHQYERLGKHPHHSRENKKAHREADGIHAPSKRTHAVYYDEYELHLPSGKSVGHRSLARYYRQNLYHYPTPEERAERLAIEAAERENRMDVDGEEPERGRTRTRALVPRDIKGLGVTTMSDPRVRGIVQKGKKEEWKNRDSKWWMHSQVAIKEKAKHPSTYLR
ncbi:uncharacterized protein CTHT_0044240 [Thermochaetoides thermophila DSM 1495]|nr:hypothetical protein CTHT_0044240 [Thermochaetoides thermophila DSM 1495]EGS19931.1 hypothetical protein CTHT_0044240 [Thermochaetoides thermophila DSM 1495]